MATPGSAEIISRVDFRPGSTIGRFRIAEQLGKGATGDVYRAEDTKLKRVVALKRLAAELRSDQSYRQRFQKEAEEVSRFCDAHVAALHDVLEVQDEMLLVMEYVEGQTLRQRMRSPLPLELALSIAEQCTEGIAAAHDLGIIHCDIKPENIMLTSHDQVKILDFGLARHLPRCDQSSTLETSTELAGTPAYMSPEVLMQRVPDSRADVFSLGVMFYEMLTGRHPFAASSFLATADRIRHETPASTRIFNPQVSTELERVVFKALAKDPRQRYANARELLEDLRAITSEPMATSVILSDRFRPTLRLALGWAVALVTVVLMAVGIYRAYSVRDSQPILKERGWVLISDFDTGRDESIPGAAIREALTIALQQSRYVNVFPRSRIYDALERMKKPGASRIDEDVGREICQRENLGVLMAGRIEQVGSVYQITVRAIDPAMGGLLFAEQQRFNRREQLLDSADRIAKRIRVDLGESERGVVQASRPLAKVSTASIEALQLYSQADDAMARGDLNRVPALLQGALSLDSNFAMAHMLLGTYYSWLVGKNGRALKEFAEAYQLRDQVTDRERRRIEAFYYAAQERYDEAAQSLSVLVGLYPDDAEAHEELASAYYDVGQLERSIAELQQVLRLDPYSTFGYRNLILYLARKGDYPSAFATFEQARQHGIDAPELHWGLGLAYLGQGKVPQAKDEFGRLGEGARADQDLKELYLVVTDLYQGHLEWAASALRRQLQYPIAEPVGLQLLRRYLLGRILLDQNKPREAVLQADLLLRSPESSLQTNDLWQAGILYARSGNLNKARIVLKRLNQSRTSAPSSWAECTFHNLQGEISLAELNLADAESAFVAGAHASEQVFSHMGLARIHQARHDWVQAAAEWQQVLRGTGEILQNDYPPELAFAHFQSARVYQQTNQPDLAIRHYRELLQIWPDADPNPMLQQSQLQLAQMTRSGPNQQ